MSLICLAQVRFVSVVAAQMAVVWHCGVLGSALLAASLVVRCMATKRSASATSETAAGPVSFVLQARFDSDAEGVKAKDAVCL